MADIIEKIEYLPPAPPTLTGDDVVLLAADHAWFAERTEVTVDGLRTEVRDKTGALRYTEIHPAYYDTATAQYVKAVPTVAEAAPEDTADYKTVGAMDKYGFAAEGWIIGIKSRLTGTQYLTKPYALTRHDGKHTNENITKGIYEYAQPATAFGEDAGRAAKWAGIFRDVDIRAEVSDGGALAVQHTWRKEAVDGSEWYGVISQVNCKAEDYLALIQADGEHDTRLQAYVTDKGQYIVEYFPLAEFQQKDMDGTVTGVADVTHDYTTISGGLGGNLDMARGSTYYLTASCTLGAYNVTTSGSSGRVTVKTSGAVGFQVNSTGTFTASYIDFTSRNDDTKGEAIAGSSGSPSAGDQTAAYVLGNGTKTSDVTITQYTVQYSSRSNGCVLGWSATSNTPWSLAYGSHAYGIVTDSSASCFIGANTAGHFVGQVTIDNVAIGSTVQTDNAACFLVGPLTASGCAITNCYFGATAGAAAWDGGVVLYSLVSCTHSVSNCVFNMPTIYSDARERGCVQTTSTVAASTLVFNILRNVIRNTGDGNGIVSLRTNGTSMTNNATDNIILDCDGASAKGISIYGTVNVTWNHTYNVYYNNTTDCFEALSTGEQTGTDPQLGNLPTGATIATGFAIPNGYAVGNMALEFDGSDTYDNLSIDETQYSATGYRYAGTKNITPGIQYQLSAFPESISVVNPNTGTTAGGTSVTLTVVGAGASQGTGTVTFGGDAAASYTSWADMSIVVTTPAHAAGAVDVVLTTYRGAVVTSAGGFTYVASSTPTITSVSPSSGRIGTNVTITGTNFGATQGTGYVSLGRVLSWADTSIVVQAGAGNGVVDVTVVTGA